MSTVDDRLFDFASKIGGLESKMESTNSLLANLTVQNEKIINSLSDMRARDAEKSALMLQQSDRLSDLSIRVTATEKMQTAHQSVLDAGRGGWKALTIAASIGTGIGAVLNAIFSFFHHK